MAIIRLLLRELSSRNDRTCFAKTAGLARYIAHARRSILARATLAQLFSYVPRVLHTTLTLRESFCKSAAREVCPEVDCSRMEMLNKLFASFEICTLTQKLFL